MKFSFIFYAGLNFLLVFFFSAVILAISKRMQLFDYHNSRKVHSADIPRTGGMALFLGFFLSLLLFYSMQIFRLSFLPIWTAFIILIIVGILDDLWSLNSVVKLFFYFIVAVFIYIGKIRISFITAPAGGILLLSPVLSFIITILWIVVLINASNLIDGIDGLVTGIVLISGIFIGIMAWRMQNEIILFFAMLMISGTSAFLVFNYPPAKFFLGDTGSTLLGLIMAVISILGQSKSTVSLTLFVPLLLFAFPIFDFFLTIIRRLYFRKNIFQADKNHAHHLLQEKFGTRRTIWIIYGFTMICGILSLLPSAFLIYVVIPVLFISAFFLILFLIRRKMTYLNNV